MIRKNVLTLLLMFLSMSCLAQFDNTNSLVRKVIVAYEKGSDGFYQKKAGALVDRVDQVVSMYGFDKKSSNLYVQTESGNYQIVLNKDYAKIYRTSKLAPMLEEEQVDQEVARVTRALEERFESLNNAIRQHRKDSVDKIRRDSLEKIRQDSIQKAFQKAVDLNYRESHDWHKVPVNKIGLECTDCGHQVYEPTIHCEGIFNDTIYHTQTVNGIMGYQYQKMHLCMINPKLRHDSKYTYHVKIFSDSLSQNTYLSPDYVRAFNTEHYTKHSEEVSAKAPWGYVDSWGFDFMDNTLLFDFSYTNTNKKAIKCIDVFFNIKDAAGNTKKTGKLRAMGPVEMFETKSWTWNDSKINVPDGMVDLAISKVVLTFKDGKMKTLVKELIYKQEE